MEGAPSPFPHPVSQFSRASSPRLPLLSSLPPSILYTASAPPISVALPSLGDAAQFLSPPCWQGDECVYPVGKKTRGPTAASHSLPSLPAHSRSLPLRLPALSALLRCRAN